MTRQKAQVISNYWKKILRIRIFVSVCRMDELIDTSNKAESRYDKEFKKYFLFLKSTHTDRNTEKDIIYELLHCINRKYENRMEWLMYNAEVSDKIREQCLFNYKNTLEELTNKLASVNSYFKKLI